MLGKVLKYDLKALNRYLIPLYAVIVGLSVMVRLLGFFEKVPSNRCLSCNGRKFCY